jgi:hypothetical protein
MNTKKLTVCKLEVENCWKDLARVPKEHRVDGSGKRIRRAKICKVIIGDKHKLLSIHGCQKKDAVILMDSITRDDLGVHEGNSYEVELQPVGWLGYLRWASVAADPAYRIPAQISLISLLLGVIGFILGVFGAISSLKTH